MRLCACGCGASLDGRRPNVRYLDSAHRSRAWRNRTGYTLRGVRGRERGKETSSDTVSRRARPSDLRITWTQLVDRLGRDVAESVLTDAQMDRLERIRG